MAPDVPDINEEILLGRTLLEQGHLGTAQRVLVRICQAHPGNPEAFGCLSDLLRRRGDGVRARIMDDYAKDLRTPLPKVPSPAPQAAPSPPPLGTKTLPLPSTGSDVPQVAPPGPPATMPLPTTDLAQVAPPGPPATMPQVGKAEPAAQALPPPAPVTMPQAVVPAPAAAAMEPALSSPTSPSPASPVSLNQTPPEKALPLPAASSAPAKATPRKSRKGRLVGVLVFLAVASGAPFGYRSWLQRKPQPPSFAAREELMGALASGSLDRLMRTREKARAVLTEANPDIDGLLHLALADAWLALDYGVASAKNAEESLRKLPTLDAKQPQHLALLETVRGTLSLDAGDRAAARQHVQLGMDQAGAQPPAMLLLLSARLHSLSGDWATAGQELARAMSAAPDFAPVLAEWALAKLDEGDPATARPVLKEFLAKNRSAAHVQLAAAEIERALGDGEWKHHADIACHGDLRAARLLRASCTLAAAQEARMNGERISAIRKAKAAAQGSDDARLLANAALVLALLGEVDAAEDLVARARKVADPKATPLAWATLAVHLGQGQLDGAPNDRPALSERALLVLRAEYLKGGGPALAPAVKKLAPGLAELDSDLRLYLELASEDGVSRGDRAGLERRADRGNPLAAFVLGVLAARENDHKQAAKRLEKALAGHGDACRAALLYLQALQAQDKPPQPNRNALRALHERCAACPLPEI